VLSEVQTCDRGLIEDDEISIRIWGLVSYDSTAVDDA